MGAIHPQLNTPEQDADDRHMPLAHFIDQFGEGLLEQVRRQNPPIYDPDLDTQTPVWRARQHVLDNLTRTPFEAQAHAVHAVVKLLLDHNEPAAVLNADMGTGKTI